MTMSSHQAPEGAGRATPRHSVRRLLPLAIVALATAVVLGMGWHRHLSFETLVHHHGAIHQFILATQIAAIAGYVAVYVIAVALSLPAGLFMTLAGGMLFGGAIGGLAALVSATTGATILFLIARTAFGEHLARRSGPVVEKVAAGFRADAFSYLLFLRLVPAFPFFLVNLVPALVGVRLGTFIAATFIGIVPGTFAFAFVGQGLDSVIRAQGATYHACLAAGRSDCHVDFDLKSAVTPELLAALAALGFIALIPMAVKRWRRRARATDSMH
jgi:uncharacterized membrane protein YdjX (TVP38/TMEM64 family)